MKNILITGGTDGIGKAIAVKLAKPGDNVTIVGRNQSKGERTAAEITSSTGSKVRFISVDFSCMKAVQAFAQDYLSQHSQLDILVHSAGVMLPKRLLTEEGLETTFAVQYMSRFVLTNTLLPALNASPTAQVLILAGGRVGDDTLDYANLKGEKTYSAFGALLTSSKAVSLYTLWLMQQPGITVYNYGPGLVRTSLGRQMPAIMNLFINTIGRLFSTTPEQAGSDIARLLNSGNQSGFYLRGGKFNPPTKPVPDSVSQQKLHTTSLAILNQINITVESPAPQQSSTR